MKFIVKNMDGLFVVKDEELTIAKMQNIVGGYIEIFPIMKNDVCIVCNEEGKLHKYDNNGNKLYPNVFAGYEVIYGNILIVGYDKFGNERDLTNEEIDTIIGGSKIL